MGHEGPTSNGYPSLASKIAARSEALVLVIDYPLVPIGNYSAIMHWSLRAFEWLAAHGPLGAACPPQPPPVLLLGGDSAGGGTAASLALRLQAERDRWPPLAGVFLFSPVDEPGVRHPDVLLQQLRQAAPRRGRQRPPGVHGGHHLPGHAGPELEDLGGSTGTWRSATWRATRRCSRTRWPLPSSPARPSSGRPRRPCTLW
ncbi:unnamed protein product [Prorocentrum cordatum]|uniref:Alpha/beta hydrolase fold-3 domain-containing protein n=1 Tax=Prorocentrum cordatum TaxID=2364126 RepID=A0ABN9VFY8_9DINO|nr:unnamed protein product [Polarella glacialis]